MNLKTGHRIAIDYGDKWIGIAISDETGLIASPVGTIAAANLHEELLNLAHENSISTIYVGLPMHLSGEEGQSAARARSLAELIAKLNIAPVRLVDERLSTTSASNDKSLIAKFGIDALAAVEILKFALDGERALGRPFGSSLDD
ncbi:MAG: Holliday junction resolvase RuvX [Candidatus Nanopelagicaceae bacterium]|nr:Holliday junction resolvase RuvX [Candidatus Nanopelagicaceae bacterium]